MIDTKSKFILSASKPDDFPRDGVSEIVVVGRSNAGKSSLLNSLLGVHGLCRTSKTPGCTKTINFFMSGKIRFVDLPGYGFAGVDKAQKNEWPRLVNEFLESRPNIRIVLFLMDCRRIPDEIDMELIHWFVTSFENVYMILTKSDKLSRSQILRQIGQLKNILLAENIADLPLVPFSTQSPEGKRNISQLMKDFV